jgi:hypothetical protein
VTFFGFGLSAWGLITSSTDLGTVSAVEGKVMSSIGGHIVQSTLTNLVQSGQNATAFATAFSHGDDLFAAHFNAADGSGGKVGAGGERFTRMPRADRTGAGEWASHTPARATGPNTQSCNGCHHLGGDDGAGEAADNVHRDANHLGQLNKMVQRNTPHLFGLGGLQKLAEEMTTDLQNSRNSGRSFLGCGVTTTAGTVTNNLTSKSINFGTITITHVGGTTNCTETLNAPPGGVKAVSADLVVRPYQWKGVVAFIRDFVRGAAHNEIGMQGTELLGSPTVDPATVDGDGDGVANELFVGDMTALTLYQAAQPRPTTRQELASLGIIPPLSSAENASIANGSAIYDRLTCASCHVRQLVANDIIFREPSANPNFRDPGDVFPNGRSYGNAALNTSSPVTFDITRDQTENNQFTVNGQPLGTFQRDGQGHAIIALFGDLRRHDLGSAVAEEVDEQGTGASVFMTENLWGVGSTAPYMHDGRATTITEAILEHGGEAQTSRNNFVALSTSDKKDVITFLNNLVLFKVEE